MHLGLGFQSILQKSALAAARQAAGEVAFCYSVRMSKKHAQRNPEVAIRREYGRLAAVYDERWPRYVRASAAQTLDRIHLAESELLLDVACGSGEVLQTLRRTYPSAGAVGIDISLEMLRVAKEKTVPDVPFTSGSAVALPFPSETFDVVVSTSAFHYWHDPLPSLKELLRVLKPGGRLVITDWCDDYLACRICDLYLRLFSASHFKTYGKEELGRLLTAAHFEDVLVERYKISWLWGMMTAQARRPV